MTDERLETTAERSSLMQRVRREGTEPEMKVRRLLWDTGARYRVNVSELPGSPDIANRSRGKAIFVHGCFWHYHQECSRGKVPTRNESFWASKLERNKRRDDKKRAALLNTGFDVLVVWECELDDPLSVQERLREFWFDDATY